MTYTKKLSLVLLRIVLGWMFFYAGITKVLDPTWTAEGYLKNAATFHGFYLWLTNPGLMPIVNFVNEWGLALLGIALIVGLFTRAASLGGILLMILYYLPLLHFPYPDPHSFIVDQHIVYIFTLGLLAAHNAGLWFGLDGFWNRRHGSLRQQQD